MVDLKNCFITLVDSLRFDAIEGVSDPGLLDSLGRKGELHTPNLNKLLDRGTALSDLHAPFAATPPSTASLLTGLYPREHHLSAFYRPLSPDVLTLADHFSEQGYYTLIGNGMSLFRKNGINDRFDEYTSTSASGFCNRIKELNEQGQPVFAYFHTFDVHRPYMMFKYPETANAHDTAVRIANEISDQLGDNHSFSTGDAVFDGGEGAQLKASRNCPVWDYLLDIHEHFWERKGELEDPVSLLSRMYVLGINEFDRFQVEPIVKFLFNTDAGAHTMFFLTGNHGESIRQKEEPTFYHGGRASQDVIKVPGMFVHSGVEKSTVSKWPVKSLVDICPTVLDEFDVDYDEDRISGESLLERSPISGISSVNFPSRSKAVNRRYPGNRSWSGKVSSVGMV